MTAPSAAVIGSTGLVGSNILTTLLISDTFRPIHTITRRAPAPTSPHLHALINTDTTTWASSLADQAPAAVFSALGTTRSAAGGIANQWKIDHDLNIELAKAAKAAGTRTFVFVSSAGTRSYPLSSAPYGQMKNGVEDAIRGLDFDHAVVLKPGVILGEREVRKQFDWIIMPFMRGLSCVGLQDYLGQDAVVIARAAVRAAQLVEEGKAPGKYWEVSGADIIRLGRTEWPGEKTEEQKDVSAL
ncbi:hypothetical protein G7046_g8649 [Stylonectria norvegica]|nr:hypothetical protein G7046_g8649 [Stylonectria norvegica]